MLLDDCWDGLDFSAWDGLVDWDRRASVVVLYITRLKINQVRESIANWINQKNNRNIEPMAKSASKIIVDH